MTAGGVDTTGNPADVAIRGDGFLRVANGNAGGNSPVFDATQSTRAGDLTFNQNGHLTTQTGQFVLGYGATHNTNRAYSATIPGGPDNPIIVPPGANRVAIGPDGSVNYQTPPAR